MNCAAKRGRPKFEDVYSDQPQAINLLIKKSDYTQLSDRAATLGRSKSSVIREAIGAYLSDKRRTLSNAKTARA